MGRREQPVPDGPLREFAQDLRALRQATGMTYRELSRRAGYSYSVLSAAAAGFGLPTLPVTLAYVGSCDGDQEAWEARWQSLADLLRATDPGLLAPEDTGSADRAEGDPAGIARPPGSESEGSESEGGDPQQFGESESCEPEAAERESAEPVVAGFGPGPAPGPARHHDTGPSPDAPHVGPLDRHDPRRIGAYRTVGRLGGGAMGEVFLAASPAGRPVAVKVIRPELARDPLFRRRFAAELAAARGVRGGHSPAVVDADPEAPRPWMATAYLSGPSLGDVVALRGALPVPVVFGLAAGIAESLEAVHAAGIVHRDLKPSNILLTDDGPKVIDFGISRALDASALTATGAQVGTAGFMAPEQAEGRPVTPAADVFALGCLLAYAATGIAPFGDGPSAGVLYRIVHGEPAAEALTCADEQLRALIEQCLQKDPRRRPSPARIIEACSARAAAGPGWLPAAVAAQTARRSADAAALMQRAARHRTLRRVGAGLAPLALVAAIAAVAAGFGLLEAPTVPHDRVQGGGPPAPGSSGGPGSGSASGPGQGAGTGTAGGKALAGPVGGIVTSTPGGGQGDPSAGGGAASGGASGAGTSTAARTNAQPAVPWIATDGATCGGMRTSQYWYAADNTNNGCGNGFWHKQTGDQSSADWVFTNVPAGRTCIFAVSIGNPTNATITSTTAEYQLYDSSTSHSDLLTRWTKENQQAARGGSLSLSAPATATGTYDLQLYDWTGDGTKEFAGKVTLTCS